MSNGKHWCLTINNPTIEDESAFRHESVLYSVFGRETGESGTPHLQAYICFRNKRRFPFIKSLFPRCHAELKRGSVQEAADYCKKDGDWIEFGTIPAEQSTSGGAVNAQRWTEAYQSAKKGDLEEIPPDLLIKYYGNFKRICADHMQKPPDLVSVCGKWYYGHAGSGKTTKARHDYPEAYIKSRDKWWDGYQGEEVVILDDLDKYHVALAGYIKDWGDKWTFKAEVKGGYIWIRPTIFIITSQYSIDDIWVDDETREAVHRRFSKLHFSRLASSINIE